MIGYEDMARAAFDNDSQAAEVPFEEIVSKLGVNVEDLRGIANQRALRAVIQMRSTEEAERLVRQAYSGTFSVEKLTEEEQELLNMYAAIWIDGMMMGVRAQREEARKDD